jgi:hypothetical protein
MQSNALDFLKKAGFANSGKSLYQQYAWLTTETMDDMLLDLIDLSGTADKARFTHEDSSSGTGFRG